MDDISIPKNGLTNKGILIDGNGYEMLGEGISNTSIDNSYIVGAKKEITNTYIADDRKKWYYRIDFQTDTNGNYKVGKSNEYYINFE